jgi:hypothetical protein
MWRSCGSPPAGHPRRVVDAMEPAADERAVGKRRGRARPDRRKPGRQAADLADDMMHRPIGAGLPPGGASIRAREYGDSTPRITPFMRG